jgi:trehalose/maltose hydrolase-like predicted phosphorylase
MWPPLLMLDPACAKSALDYRWNRRAHAHDKAVTCGTKNHASSGGQGALDVAGDALMFPWESCLTGVGEISRFMAHSPNHRFPMGIVSHGSW